VLFLTIIYKLAALADQPNSKIKLETKKKILLLISVIIIFIVVDRLLWMEERAKNLFLWESGPLLGDPISYNYDFKINGSEITFEKYKNAETWPEVAEKRSHKFYFVGCYSGTLYLYDKTNGKVSTYNEK
jgi:hypothetical protein